MNDHLGIVIDRSLKDPAVLPRLPVIARRQVGSWGFLLVSVPEAEIDRFISVLQSHLIEATVDCWYAHFFREDDLIVVYQDRIFHATLDPGSWGPAVQHGLERGVPREQLDFKPRTREDALAFFGMV